MAKKTYFTKKDMLSFAEHIVSDERRFAHQQEAKRKHEAGYLNFHGWATTVRIVTEQDFIDWKNKQDEH